MSDNWRTLLPCDPLSALLAAGDDEARAYYVRRNLLGEAVGPVEALWALPAALRLLKKQQADGSWRYPGARPDHLANYCLLETYRSLRLLVEMYGLDRRHPAIEDLTDLRKPVWSGPQRGAFAMQVSQSVRCDGFPCADVRHEGYVVPNVEVDPARLDRPRLRGGRARPRRRLLRSGRAALRADDRAGIQRCRRRYLVDRRYPRPGCLPHHRRQVRQDRLRHRDGHGAAMHKCS